MFFSQIDMYIKHNSCQFSFKCRCANVSLPLRHIVRLDAIIVPIKTLHSSVVAICNFTWCQKLQRMKRVVGTQYCAQMPSPRRIPPMRLFSSVKISPRSSELAARGFLHMGITCCWQLRVVLYSVTPNWQRWRFSCKNEWVMSSKNSWWLTFAETIARSIISGVVTDATLSLCFLTLICFEYAKSRRKSCRWARNACVHSANLRRPPVGWFASAWIITVPPYVSYIKVTNPI